VVEPPTSPIFVVGSPRSGTTLVRLMLDSHPDISCGPETHFLADLANMERKRWRRIERFGVTQEEWRAEIARLFDWFHRSYAERRGRRRWADKTPLYAVHLPYIDALFPDCQVVHIIRDGRDVIASYNTVWGFRRTLQGVDQWTEFTRAARAWGAEAGPARYLEIRYEELVAEPEATMRRVLAFLGEAWTDAVLAFDEAEHDMKRKGFDNVANLRRRQSGDDSLIYRSRVGAGRRELRNPVVRLRLRRRGGSLLRELGY
jgi:hypothetical protein